MRVELPLVTDPVGEALHLLRMSGTFYCRSEFSAPWALRLPPMERCLMLHVVTTGRCLLELDGAPATTIQPGDLALVPHGEGHILCSGTGLRADNLFEIEHHQISERYEILTLGKGGERTTMICGLFQFDDPAAEQLIGSLPKVITINSWDSQQSDWMQSTLRMISLEARQMHPGGETVITRLADILVVYAIRSWITSPSAVHSGWLAALHDSQIGPTLSAIHRNPGCDWTLESLASHASMSRSAFAARFTELIGQSAMQYVTRWRMNTAQKTLAEGRVTVAEVAHSLGYESEPAFNRAFKRHTGVSPGSIKTKAKGRRSEPTALKAPT
jgi:AraC-like DNA-binding protein